MKVTPRFTVRAALVLTAAGVIGAFGACKKDGPVGPPPPPPSLPPPPPPSITAPSGLAATPTVNSVALTWADNSTNETGFRVDRCSGAACTAFAQVGTNTAANITTFSDAGLTASTAYSYRVRAFNATDTSAWTSTVPTTTLAAVASFTMIGAGEITSCASSGNTQTATLIQNQVTADPTTIVFTTGDNVATGVTNTGSYTTCFDPSWGRFKTNMRAALGDGDFQSIGVDGVYAYFQDTPQAAGAPNGWYSYDVGPSWHVIVLNTGLWQHGACALTGTDGGAHAECVGVATPQLDWLTADLAGTTKQCIMAISWDRRLYTSGTGSLGKNMNLNPIARILYGAGVDLLVSGKDKQYERFPKTNVDGALDAAGFAQFIVGTGGRSLDQFHTPLAGNPVAAQFGGQGNTVADSWGVVKFTLNASSYKWEFISTLSSGGLVDSGEQACN